jgi:hypothetical protein
LLVKKALSRHMDLDTPMTWSVFCDQVWPPNDAEADDADPDARDRIRALVLSYLAHEARPHIARHVKKPENEQVLVEGLYRVSPCLFLTCVYANPLAHQAVPKLNVPADIRTIVLDILLPLPSFGPNSPRVKELYELLLVRPAAGITAKPPMLDTPALACLELAGDLVARKLVSPVGMLRWFEGHVQQKHMLDSLNAEARRELIASAMRVLAACGAQPADAELAAVVKRVTGGAWTVLDVGLSFAHGLRDADGRTAGSCGRWA